MLLCHPGALLGTAPRVHFRTCRYFTCSKPPPAVEAMARLSLMNQSRSFSATSTSVRHPWLVTALQGGWQHQRSAEGSRQLQHTSALPDAIRIPSAAALLQRAPAVEDSAFWNWARSMLGTLAAATLALAIFLSSSPHCLCGSLSFWSDGVFQSSHAGDEGELEPTPTVLAAMRFLYSCSSMQSINIQEQSLKVHLRVTNASAAGP